MDLMLIVSFAVSIVSIVLAIVAIFFAYASEKRSQDNFEKTQKIMHEIYDKTKDALAQVDKRTEVIENVVQRNQEQLISTMTNILNETVIPKKPDMGEEMGIQLFSQMLQDPSKFSANIKNLSDIFGELKNIKTQ